MKKIFLTIKRILFVICPLFIVSFMSTNEWVARSQMIDNEYQKNIVYKTTVFLNDNLHKKQDSVLAITKEEAPIYHEDKVKEENIKEDIDIKINSIKSNEEKKEAISKSKNELIDKKEVPIKQENFKRVLLVGDSLMAEIAFGMKDQVSKNISVKDIHKSSTGLTNKDYYDWNTVSSKAAISYSPDLILIHMGGNDGQDMKVNGKFVRLYTEEWNNDYYKRVKSLISTLESASPNAKIIWIGLPGMRDPKYEKKTEIIRQIQKNAAIDSGIEFIDAGDAIGKKYIKQEKINGKMLDLRRTDGIHYSRDGGEQIATLIINKKNIEKK